MASQQSKSMSQASIYDSLRVFQTVIVPTLAKGVIKRRPWVEALAQHLGLDTNAVQLLQELRKKYGPSPLLLWLPFRSQVVILDPKDASQVLSGTPVPFTSATKEKKSSLGHFEPNHILIAGPERRAQLRPVHENALATKDRVHPLMERFQTVINEELDSLIQSTSTQPESTLDFPTFSEAWFRIVRRITLGDAARDDTDLTATLDAIRLRGNWGFMAPANDSKLAAVQSQLAHYIQTAEPGGSLASLLPKDTNNNNNLDLVSQLTHYLFGFDAAAIATFRALALLGAHPDAQASAHDEAAASNPDRPFARAIFLESLRLWPTTPAILRELDQDAAIGGHGQGHVFPKGTGVVIFTPLFHRDTENLEWADRLEPGQWMGEHGRADVDLAKGLELVRPGLEAGKLPGTLDHAEVVLRVKRVGEE